MSMSGIQSSTFNPYQLASNNPMQQQLQQLSQALQSGNLSEAQSDFATLQQAFSQPAATSGATSTATTNPLNQSFNQLASDLQSGNLAAAQKDLSTVQQDLHGGVGTPPFHRVPPNQHTGGGLSNGTGFQFKDPNQFSPSASSTNLASAQQTYATLAQQLQQFALGGAALTAESPISFDA